MTMKKLNLKELQVKSFVTQIRDKDQQTLKGGKDLSRLLICRDYTTSPTCSTNCSSCKT